MNTLFPIFLKLDQINILLVGGGEIAEEKLHFLLKSSPKANVEIVTLDVIESVYRIVFEHPQIKLNIRAFQSNDLNEKHLVVVATNNPELNDQIRQLAIERSVLLNVADNAELCDFYLGGIVTKGDLKLAISTNGKSPIMAKRLRQFFEAELPNNLNEVINGLKHLRTKLNGSFERKVKALNTLTKELIEQ